MIRSTHNIRQGTQEVVVRSEELYYMKLIPKKIQAIISP